MNPRSLFAACVVLSFPGLSLIPGCSRGTAPSHDEIAGPPALKANANDLRTTIVSPHLEVEIAHGKNILWCASFQIAWNELCALAGEDIRIGGDPPAVAILNKKAAKKSDIDEAACLAMADWTKDGIVERIRKALDVRFQGAARPQLLDDIPPGFVAYAYLWKSLPFEWAFKRLDRPLSFRGKEVAAFGFDEDFSHSRRHDRVARQVKILQHPFENEAREIIIEIETRSDQDRLILAKVKPSPTLEATVRDVIARAAKPDPRRLDTNGTFIAPILDFEIIRSYREVCGTVVSENPKINGHPLDIAEQIVRFKLDEKGAVLKSEAVLAEPAKAMDVLIFDAPYLVLLIRAGASVPYFALWVDNAELMIPKPAAH